jgi:deazaflavin-dependent oxidoreductase (nitroreductase family)
MVEPHRPMTLRLLAVGQRALHRLTGARLGSFDAGAAAPRGRALTIITVVHRRLYRWTGGLVGGDAGGLPTLLLTTTGRRTGKARTVPLPFFDLPAGLAVVASFAGNPKNPAWYENLVAHPEVEVQIKRRRFRAVATPADSDVRPLLWSDIVARAPMYGDYQTMTAREIPVVILREQRP